MRNLHVCVVTACDPPSQELKGASQRDEELFSSSHMWALTHSGTLDDGEGISGGEPESCQQTLPAGLQRPSDSICYREMSLAIPSGSWLLPRVCDLALVGNGRQGGQSGHCCSHW